MKRIEEFAKQTFIALKNPYGTVCKVYPQIIDEVNAIGELGQAWYVGVKNTQGLEAQMKLCLQDSPFLLHTIDTMALGGRAVDLKLVNPLSGRWMSGSSSGTALNVFYGMNDLGIGTDGGGSVLAPAAALNLIGFISPLVEPKFRKAFVKTSTDQISFTPSIGFIAREMEPLKAVIGHFLGKKAVELGGKIEVLTVKDEKLDLFGDRKPLIDYLETVVKPGVMVVSEEGPVDRDSMGDSVFGHFDESTRQSQRESGKGLMRVVNMSGKTALILPGKGLGMCRLYICESKLEDIAAMIQVAEFEGFSVSSLVRRYFGNLNMYL